MRILGVKRTQVPEDDHVLKNAHVLKRAEQRMAVNVLTRFRRERKISRMVGGPGNIGAGRA